MSAEPTHEKFHGIHPRKGNNVHERQKRDRWPTIADAYDAALINRRMPSVLYVHANNQLTEFLNSQTDAGNSITL